MWKLVYEHNRKVFTLHFATLEAMHFYMASIMSLFDIANFRVSYQGSMQ